MSRSAGATARRDVPSRGVSGRGGVGMKLYSDAGFGGQSVRIEHDAADLYRANYNDRACFRPSSPAARGRSPPMPAMAAAAARTAPGQYERLGRLSGQVSSVRRVR